MNKFRPTGLFLASLLAVSIEALAPSAALAQQDPRISVAVEAIPANITLARDGSNKVNQPLVTYAAYRVTLTNGATNTLNRVFLSGTATNVGGTDAVLYDDFVANTGDSCQAGATPNSVSCSLASLAPYGGTSTFYVVFKGPKTGTRIDFNWTAGGFEGGGVGNGCCSQSGKQSTGLVDPSTDPSFRTQAKTFVKPSTGGTLFTGAEAIATSNDGWTTTVDVPAYVATTPTTATINEFTNAELTELACPSYSTYSTCFASRLSIPGTFASLEITIRLDKAFFNLGRTDPATVPLYYTGDAEKPKPDYVPFYPHSIRLCAADAADPSLAPYIATLGSVPLPGRPCFSDPPRIIPNSDPVKDSRGDLEYRVSARDNGRYSQ
jgi:hypothetical protein